MYRLGAAPNVCAGPNSFPPLVCGAHRRHRLFIFAPLALRAPPTPARLPLRVSVCHVAASRLPPYPCSRCWRRAGGATTWPMCTPPWRPCTPPACPPGAWTSSRVCPAWTWPPGCTPWTRRWRRGRTTCPCTTCRWGLGAGLGAAGGWWSACGELLGQGRVRGGDERSSPAASACASSPSAAYARNPQYQKLPCGARMHVTQLC